MVISLHLWLRHPRPRNLSRLGHPRRVRKFRHQSPGQDFPAVCLTRRSVLHDVYAHHPFTRYYVSFITQLDPNALGTAAPLVGWPQWTSSSAQLLEIGGLKNGLTSDNFRSGAYDFLASKVQSFRI